MVLPVRNTHALAFPGEAVATAFTSAATRPQGGEGGGDRQGRLVRLTSKHGCSRASSWCCSAMSIIPSQMLPVHSEGEAPPRSVSPLLGCGWGCGGRQAG